MKKLFFAWGLASVLLSCENGSSNKDPFTNLATASIADAAIIYQRSATTRSATDENETEEYWKIDRKGNETKILLYDKTGNVSDVKIKKIGKLNDNLLLIETDWYIRLIADLQTEKLYQAPQELTVDTTVKEGPDGNLYFCGNTWCEEYKTYTTLFRLDPVHFTIEQVLPEGQRCSSFLLNRGNAIYYSSNDKNLQNGGGKIQMPGKRIYPTSNEATIFLSGANDFYWIDRDSESYSDFTIFNIFKWEQLSNNELEQRFVCPLSSEPLPKFTEPLVVQNQKTGRTAIFVPFTIYEFDGSRIVGKKTYAQGKETYIAENLWDDIQKNDKESLTNDYISFTWDRILTLNLTDYSVNSVPYTFPVNEYEIYETTIDEVNKRQIFTALRYADGKIVIGEISAQGKISIISEKESGNKIVNLITLN